MPLSDNEYTELQTILQGLQGVDLYEKAQGFVDDQVRRERQYGQDIFLSVKQWAWLRSLYSDKVGVAKGHVAGKVSDSEAEGPQRDLDDEIPF